MASFRITSVSVRPLHFESRQNKLDASGILGQESVSHLRGGFGKDISNVNQFRSMGTR